MTTKPQLYLYAILGLCFGSCEPQIISPLISFFHIHNCLIWSTIFYDVWNEPGEFRLRKTYWTYWTDDISDKFLYDEGAAVNIHEENCVIQLPISQHVQTNVHQRSLSKKAQSQLQWTQVKGTFFFLGIFLVQRITTLKYNTSNQGTIFLMPSYYWQYFLMSVRF